MKPSRLSWPSLAALAAIAAASGCEFFDTVPAPTQDSTPPMAVLRLLEYGPGADVDLISVNDTTPVSIVTDDLSREFIAVAAAFDPQGAERVLMVKDGSLHCTSGDGVASVRALHLGSQEKTQAVSEAGTVETGVWTADYVYAGRWANACPAGAEPISVTYRWGSYVRNFFGAETYHAGGTIRYEF